MVGMQTVCPLCQRAEINHLHERRFQDVNWSLARCASCGLHFTDPTPTESEIRRFYSGDFHVQLRRSGASEQAFGARFARYVDWIRHFVPPGRVLDVGCATGLLPRLLQDAGYVAEGVELHPETAQWGAAHYGIPIKIGSLDVFSSQVNIFDLITLTEVVEHTPHPVEFLVSVHRLLKNDGHALVTFPDIVSLKSRYYRRLARVTRREWVWVTCHMPLHIWEFTYETAIATFAKAGFSIVGFRRSEVNGELSGKFVPLMWPMKPLNLHFLATRFGSQMEFLVRKTQ
jgi:2-polyprenyl-3-methyl-5-hydroxy-6-metoxy-1,4-benzoquinol methylase